MDQDDHSSVSYEEEKQDQGEFSYPSPSSQVLPGEIVDFVNDNDDLVVLVRLTEEFAALIASGVQLPLGEHSQDVSEVGNAILTNNSVGTPLTFFQGFVHHPTANSEGNVGRVKQAPSAPPILSSNPAPPPANRKRKRSQKESCPNEGTSAMHSRASYNRASYSMHPAQAAEEDVPIPNEGTSAMHSRASYNQASYWNDLVQAAEEDVPIPNEGTGVMHSSSSDSTASYSSDPAQVTQEEVSYVAETAANPHSDIEYTFQFAGTLYSVVPTDVLLALRNQAQLSTSVSATAGPSEEVARLVAYFKQIQEKLRGAEISFKFTGTRTKDRFVNGHKYTVDITLKMHDDDQARSVKDDLNFAINHPSVRIRLLTEDRCTRFTRPTWAFEYTTPTVSQQDTTVTVTFDAFKIFACSYHFGKQGLFLEFAVRPHDTDIVLFTTENCPVVTHSKNNKE